MTMTIDDFTDSSRFPPVVDMMRLRLHLRLTKERMARMLETDVTTITKMEQPPTSVTWRAPAVRMVRLLSAYLEGWRPDDWPLDSKEIDL